MHSARGDSFFSRCVQSYVLYGLSALMATSIAASAVPAQLRSANHFQRSLIIFAPDMLSKDLSKQLSAMSGHQKALEARGIALVYVIGKSVSAQPGWNHTATSVRLRAHYKVANDEFRAILVETNGEPEMLSDVPVTANDVFQTTDAVPIEDKGD